MEEKIKPLDWDQKITAKFDTKFMKLFMNARLTDQALWIEINGSYRKFYVHSIQAVLNGSNLIVAFECDLIEKFKFSESTRLEKFRDENLGTLHERDLEAIDRDHDKMFPPR